MVVMDGPVGADRTIPGDVLSLSEKLPYKGLAQFGDGFLNRFVGSQLSNPVLKYLSFIDTPGILSSKHRNSARAYDFNKVMSWFSSRSDLILLMFDANKLDVSDEFQDVVSAFKGNEDKIRCILNKADTLRVGVVKQNLYSKWLLDM